MQPYVSIDIETTGLNPETCQVLEIGAVIDDMVRPIADLPRFRAVLKHKEIKGEPFAMSMHPALFKAIATLPSKAGNRDVSSFDIAEAMTHPMSVVSEFLEWLKKNGMDMKVGIQPAGKNYASFDRPFLETCVPNWKAEVKVKHRTIDPGNLFWKVGDEYIPDTKTCYERAGIPNVVAHTAVEDAMGVVKLIRVYHLYKHELSNKANVYSDDFKFMPDSPYLQTLRQ
jgi:DNA polymerase III, epsilon subunit and related 3''-5'' exonucleases